MLSDYISTNTISVSPYINITSFTIMKDSILSKLMWSVKKVFYLCDHWKIFWKCFPHMPFSSCYTTFVHEASLLSLVQPEIFLNILAQIRLHFHKFPVQNILVLTFRLLLLLARFCMCWSKNCQITHLL